MIEITNLHKRFGKNTVLSGVNLSLQEPGIHAVLGPNGSGKTTLIKSILGMVCPDQGSISIGGQPTGGQWLYRKDLGYLPQIAEFPGNLKVGELFRMIEDLRQQPAAPEPLVERFGLQPFLNKKLSTLSGGTRQKVNLVLTFMFEPPVYILDEPTTGLDPGALIALKELIRTRVGSGALFLITTHIMPLVEEMAQSVIYLLEGKVYFEGSLKTLYTLTGKTHVEPAIAAIAARHHV
ncbi:ABC transporter ATP-binding protein [Robiginitalea sp. M366]|uniref:ABC transporter ATP-binding protein n=1 Tax=Robiginitalea aestuariiviva TaxID=3036903 RepID=UPI00240DD546|nr:ABC transporter ATP-binding protein [Robiginitalea aestuariiviva]MDG1573323.1 ABC transporter ATP-binding protein [Robiginitalea aestuariiviva]